MKRFIRLIGQGADIVYRGKPGAVYELVRMAGIPEHPIAVIRAYESLFQPPRLYHLPPTCYEEIEP
ncbi:hypothetical protein HMSP1_7 [Sinorhizobium phage HMSP1-Susan]|nr:hypothetical protein HMSP1_7 [Sinorhizobium phage HMSP1-Susan]